MQALHCHVCSLLPSSNHLRQSSPQNQSRAALRIDRQAFSQYTSGQQSKGPLRHVARCNRHTVAKAGENDGEGDLLIEEELRSKRRKKKSKVNVVAPQVQQAYGLEPQTTEGQLETSYLLLLGLIFVIIILEGLFIATSGFLPEAADQFAQDVVYRAFSPTVGFFLLLSTIYGIWKSKQ